MAKIINGRVRQKAAPLAEWQNSDLESLDGEQLFVRSDVDDSVIGFKFGAKGKKFSELPYPDLTVRDKATPFMSWVGRQSGVYIPTTNGNYNGVNVNLTDGYQVLYWDGATVEKVVYPTDYTGAVFGGVIDDTYDLSTPPTEPTWYIASAGTYNTTPPTTLTETSIFTWNGQSWSHIPFELEVRGEFLVADNIQEVRNITSEVAQLLVNGTYKGVTVLGYYEPGDTPAAINYYLSDTSESDDGGSVIAVGDIKLEHDFNYYVDLRYFGVKGDGTDETVQIQRAHDKSIGGITFVPNPTTEYLSGQFFAKSNTNVQFDSNVSWKAVDTLNQGGQTFECLFRFVDTQNAIWICNDATFRMNKPAYTSEHNAIFFFDSAVNVEIIKANAKDSGGDGFNIGGMASSSIQVPRGSKNHSVNITLTSCTADNSRRNGVSLIGVNGFRASDGVFSRSAGVLGAGFNVEPEQRNDYSDNIVLDRCTFLENTGKGFQLTMQKFNRGIQHPLPVMNVTLNDCRAISNGLHGFCTQYNRPIVKGKVTYNNCLAQENYYCGFFEYSSHPNVQKVYNNPRMVNNNTSGATEQHLSHGAQFYAQVYTAGGDPELAYDWEFGNSEIHNPVVLDDRTPSKTVRGISFRKNGTYLPQDVFIENPTFTGVSTEDIFFEPDSINCVVKYKTKPSVARAGGSTVYDVEVLDSFKEITNSTTSSSMSYRLPAAQKGIEFTFRVSVANQLTVTPESGSRILGLQIEGTTYTVSSSTIGNFISLRGREDGHWEVIGIYGNWSNRTTSWSTANRPTSPKTGQSGYNISLSAFEYWNGTVWKTIPNQGVHVPNGSSIDTLLTVLRDAGVIASS